MLDPPKTLEEAKKCRYNKWTGNPKGFQYKEERCAYEVHDIVGWGQHQCFRKNGYGPNGLYCKQHAKKVKP